MWESVSLSLKCTLLHPKCFQHKCKFDHLILFLTRVFISILSDAQNYSSSKQFQDAIATFNELPPYPEDCIYSDLEESFPSIEENALMSVNKVPTPSHELSYDSARMTPPCSPNKDLLLMAVLDHLSSFYADGEQGQQLFRGMTYSKIRPSSKQHFHTQGGWINSLLSLTIIAYI